jgi:hypothetical protein
LRLPPKTLAMKTALFNRLFTLFILSLIMTFALPHSRDESEHVLAAADDPLSERK